MDNKNQRWVRIAEVLLGVVMGVILTLTVVRYRENNRILSAKYGDWLKLNGKAIYNTTITPHYNEDNVWFTSAKDGSRIYAILRLDEGKSMPATISWSENLPKKAIRLVSNGKKLKYKIEGNCVTVSLPSNLPQQSLAMEIE